MIDPEDQEIQEHDEAFVDKKVQELMGHFDAVQVFVTRQEPDGRTMAYSAGRGNFYSRWGVVHRWLSDGDNVTIEAPDDGPEESQGEDPDET